MAPSNRRSLKKKNICFQCKLVIEENDQSIECDECEREYHDVCTQLDKRQFKCLLDNENEEFVCHVCNNKKGNKNNISVKDELEDIKRELKKLDQLSVMHETMTFMSQQYDDILRGVAENNRKLELVQKENKALRQEVTDLKKSVKFLNDQRVKNDCIVTGVREIKDLSAAATIVKLSKAAGVEIEEKSISDAFFLRSRKENERKTVVVKFDSRKSKEALMSIKPKLKDMEDTKNVYVNDFLSRECMELFNYAKSLKKVGYRSVYVSSGRVFVKKSDLSKAKLIRDKDHVDKLLEEAATFQEKRRSRHVATGEDSDNNFESPC
uniref:PHD-type domain-containing protein n=1 Tax=Musca domestica TaxID=7370 RepID=A0A1I8NKJ5_MUSDO